MAMQEPLHPSFPPSIPRRVKLRPRSLEKRTPMNATAAPASAPPRRRRNPIGLTAAVLIALLILWVLLTMWWWDKEPEQFDPVTVTTAHMKEIGRPMATGAVTTYTLVASVNTLLDKRGGYLSNDKLPPGVFMDNMPNWEFGSLTASRDLAR